MRSRVFPTIRILSVLVATVVSLSGCAAFGGSGFYWNLLQARRAGRSFYRSYEHVDRDVAFTDVSDVRLDVYSPPGGDDHPVFIFVHGGSWTSYDKETFVPVAMQLLPRDMVVVIPDYTLYPDATYEQMAREVAAAVEWTMEHATDYRGDPRRIVLGGHSAGGHLSALVAFDPKWLAEFDRTPDELCGWIGLSGVYDVARHVDLRREAGEESPTTTAVMGGEKNFETASPITYVRQRHGSRVARAWLIHGEDDETVPVSISESFAVALQESGVDTVFLPYPQTGHSDFLFEALSDPDARVLRDIGAVLAGCGAGHP
ncbi:MAG: alpha/beta hydrolase [bacterium]